MSAARHTAALEADFEEVADQRRTDRRARERRGRPNRFDPLFAATLLRHIAEAEHPVDACYAPTRTAAGVRLDIRA